MDTESEGLSMASYGVTIGGRWGTRCPLLYTGRYFVSLHKKLSLRGEGAVPLGLLMAPLKENGKTLASCIPNFHAPQTRKA